MGSGSKGGEKRGDWVGVKKINTEGGSFLAVQKILKRGRGGGGFRGGKGEKPI